MLFVGPAAKPTRDGGRRFRSGRHCCMAHSSSFGKRRGACRGSDKPREKRAQPHLRIWTEHDIIVQLRRGCYNWSSPSGAACIRCSRSPQDRESSRRNHSDQFIVFPHCDERLLFYDSKHDARREQRPQDGTHPGHAALHVLEQETRNKVVTRRVCLVSPLSAADWRPLPVPRD